MIITPLPLVRFLGVFGAVIWLVELAVTMYFALKAEKFKKRSDIHTYREIVAFMNGETIENSDKIAETAKRPYQKVMAAIVAGLVALVFCIIIGTILF